MRFSPAMLACALGYLYPANLPAQTLTFTGAAPYVNFGNVYVCRLGENGPTPCSETVTLDYQVTGGGALGAPIVVTQGAPGLDFTLASGSTCVGGVSTGQTCAVNVTYKPRYPGAVNGAVQVVAANGSVLATTPIWGTGLGPLVGTLTGGVIATTSFPNQQEYDSLSAAPVVDGAGNVFLALNNLNGFSEPSAAAVFELPAGGGPPAQVPFNFAGTQGPNDVNGAAQLLAEDGAGDLFALAPATASNSINNLLELPAGGGPQITYTFDTATNLTTVAADGAGDVFLLNQPAAADATDQILKLPSGCNSIACVVAVAEQPGIYGMSVDVAGDVFFSYSTQGNSTATTELPANGGAPIALGSAYQLGALNTGAFDGLGDFFQLGGTEISYDYNGEDIVETPAGPLAPIALAQAFTWYYEGYPVGLSFALTANSIGDVFVAETPNFTPNQELIAYYRSQFAPLNFGSIPVGTSTTLPLAITNTGNQPLTFTPYFVSPSYQILSATPAGCEAATAPGATCTLNIQFTALRVGPHTIELTLSDNVPNDTTLLLEGMGTN